MESAKLLEPYGNENPQPILYSDAWQTWPPKIVGKTHLKALFRTRMIVFLKEWPWKSRS